MSSPPPPHTVRFEKSGRPPSPGRRPASPPDRPPTAPQTSRPQDGRGRPHRGGGRSGSPAASPQGGGGGGGGGGGDRDRRRRSSSRSRRRRDGSPDDRRSSSRRSGSRSRRGRRPAGSEQAKRPPTPAESKSPSASPRNIPPMCHLDLSCTSVNDDEHQRDYRHTCRRQNCEFLWMDEHRRLFAHPDTGPLMVPEKREVPPPVATQPAPLPPSTYSTSQPSTYSSHPTTSYATTTLPRRRSPLRPPVRPVSDDTAIFAPGSDNRSFNNAAPPISPIASSTSHIGTPALPSASLDEEQELRALKLRQQHLEETIKMKQSQASGVAGGSSSGRKVISPARHHPPPANPEAAAKLSHMDQQLGERLTGLALLKELESLAHEVRTLRHLQHYRSKLSKQHTAGTVNYQLDHSTRRVEASVKRCVHLSTQLHPDDVVQARAADEVAFAQELLAVQGIHEGTEVLVHRHVGGPMVETVRAAERAGGYHPTAGVGGEFDDAQAPRLVHTSISAPVPLARLIETPY